MPASSSSKRRRRTSAPPSPTRWPQPARRRRRGTTGRRRRRHPGVAARRGDRARAHADRPGSELLAFEDLDLATLVATEASTERLKPKVDELIEELRAHQGLLDTLVAYFAHDLDVMRTAEAMGVHHNSLRYRLGRVEQVLGRSLKDPATIASLYIALTAHRKRAPGRSTRSSRVFVEYRWHLRGRLHRGWQMNIGIPTEIKPDERRVAITPAGARELTRRGHRVLVQRGAGTGSGYPDSPTEPSTPSARRSTRSSSGRNSSSRSRSRCARRSSGCPSSTRCSPTCTSRRTRGSLWRSPRPVRAASPTRRSRTRTDGCAPRPDERDRGPARRAGRSDGDDRARRRARPADRRGAGRGPGRGPRPRRRRRRAPRPRPSRPAWVRA